MAISDEASTPPSNLRLPLAVDIEKIAISRFDYGLLFAASELRGSFSSDGLIHRLADFHAQIGSAGIAGAASLGAEAPLPLQVSASVAGQVEEQAVRLVVTADGPLDSIALKILAEEGLRGTGQATLTPFARHTFATAQLELADVDPAAWVAGAPVARLVLRTDIKPDERQPGAIAGTFDLRQQHGRSARPPAPAAGKPERPLRLGGRRRPFLRSAGPHARAGAVERFRQLAERQP